MGSNFIFRAKLFMFQKVSYWGHLGIYAVIKGAQMTGNVPSTVWVSPGGLLTFRFTVHTQRRVCTVSDLPASQVSSVETSEARVHSPELTLYLMSRSNVWKGLTRTANLSKVRLSVSQEGQCPPCWVHPDRYKEEELTPTLTRYQTELTILLFLKASVFGQEQ